MWMAMYMYVRGYWFYPCLWFFDTDRILVCSGFSLDRCCSSFQFFVLSYCVSLRSEFRVICVCLCIMVSSTCCVLFWFYFSPSCVPYDASFSGFSFLIAPSVFSNVYFTVLFELFCMFSPPKETDEGLSPFWRKMPLFYCLIYKIL
jgi:hypothetical protein